MTMKKLTTRRIRELLAKRTMAWNCDGFERVGCRYCPYQLKNRRCGLSTVRERARADIRVDEADLEALEAMRQYWKEHEV